MSKTAPYGTWDSPITSDVLAQKAVIVDVVLVDSVTSAVYHIERRPSEKGRSVIVDTKTGKDVFGPDFNARSGVQEYGGGAVVAYNGVIYFSNFANGRLYKTQAGSSTPPEAITPENSNHRFADLAVHPTNNSLIVAVLEDHTHPKPSEVVTSLYLIDVESKTLTKLVDGADFYSSPRFSPDGSRLAWIQWFHPDMPWEGAELHLASVNVSNQTLKLVQSSHIAGSKKDVSVAYPFWSPDGSALYFTSDAGSLHFQNPWVYKDGAAQPALHNELPQEFGEPAWILGWSYSAPLDTAGSRALFVAIRDGRSVLHVLDTAAGTTVELESPYVDIADVRYVAENAVVFIGRRVDEPAAVVRADFTSATPTFATLKTTASADFGSEIISAPQPLSLRVPPNDEPLYVVYYAPKNPAYTGPSDASERPPAVISIHGGPTAKETQGLAMIKQYFTSRGFAWVDINYGGSSGYGRAYCDRLKGQWGVVDVQDTIAAVTQLSGADHGFIDPKRLCIRGGSAGGFTVLNALSDKKHPAVFAAGTSSYGVSDLERLAEDTHKFESRYLEKLIGGTLDEVPQVYKERSPVNHADRIQSPLLILQGSDDAVVPPAQAEAIVESIKKRGGKVEYTVFEGEGHGWRKAENIKRALEEELQFYERTLSFKK